MSLSLVDPADAGWDGDVCRCDTCLDEMRRKWMENENTQAQPEAQPEAQPAAAPQPDLVAKRDQLTAALQEHRQAARELLERQQAMQQHIARLEGAVAVLNEVLPPVEAGD